MAALASANLLALLNGLFNRALTIYTGKGSVVKQGNVYTLTHNTSTRRVLAKLDTAQKKGNVTLQEPVSAMKCSITDSNTLNNSCLCN